MSQSYNAVFTSEEILTAIEGQLSDSLEALRSLFAGANLPDGTGGSAAPIAHQLAFKTADGLLYKRNAANSAWEAIMPIRAHRLLTGALAAGNYRVFTAPEAMVVSRVVLISDATTLTSGAGTKEYTWMLRNVTAGVTLFSGTPSTATVLVGVGGGEITLDVAYQLLANQNTSVAKGDLLRFEVGKVGSPTAINELHVEIEGNRKFT